MENKDEEVLEEVPEELVEEKEEVKEENEDEVTETTEVKEEVKEEKTEVVNDTAKNNSDKDKKKKIIICSIIGVIILVCILCAVLPRLFTRNDTTTTVKNEKKDFKSELRMTGNGLEDFDLAFLKLENEAKNKVYSPLSIKYALAMLQEGAEGDSKEQITALIGDYKSNKYVNSKHMSFANAMFINNAYKEMVSKDFSTNLGDKYNAELIYDDFATANNINGWVNQKTLGLIDKLYEDSDVQNAKFYLVNALAIDMEWNKKLQATYGNYKDAYSVNFDHEDYRDSIGLLSDDSSYTAMSFDNGKLNAKVSETGATINNYDIVNELGRDNIKKEITEEYTEWLSKGGCGKPGEDDVDASVEKFIKELDENYKKVITSTDFRYNVDEDVKMFAKELKEYDGLTLEYIGIMPKNVPLNNFIKDITAKELNAKIAGLKDVNIENSAPKKVTRIVGNIPLFKYDDKLNLMKDLKDLGVTDVFDLEKANLSKIAKDDKELYISSADHKATIDFSNDGIKAAAVTSMGGIGASSCGFEHIYEVPVEIIDLNFDKPYMYIIRDKATGEVWFTGSVYEPTKATKDVNTHVNRLTKEIFIKG